VTSSPTALLTSPAAQEAGDYYISATLNVSSWDSDFDSCFLAGSNEMPNEDTTVQVGPANPGATGNTRQTISMVGDMTLNAGDYAEIICSSTGPGVPDEFLDGSATAILIDNSAT